MSSSGLIYAVIVGAWAAYLVPMWLRRQDELNEARPTERFSTAIRLLSGRAGMERRYAKGLEERSSGDADASGDGDGSAGPDRGATAPDVVTDSVDVRAFAVSAPEPAPVRVDTGTGRADRAATGTGRTERPARPAAHPTPSAAQRARRSKVLARRRRTTMALFLAFTGGSVVAAVGGIAFLWAPALPAILLSLYIAHLRAQERRRFTFTMDRRRAEAAAQRLREHRSRIAARPEHAEVEPPAEDGPAEPVAAPESTSPHTAGRRALVEQTDHAEWVDQQRRSSEGDSWDPVPVPLPTYVTAPVAPRATGGVDLDAPDAWSSARSSVAEPVAEAPPAEPAPVPEPAPATRRPAGRRARERGRTPLFDQYADEDRPRAANE
ncbi:divisome protein SepX/GlpR [Streptomyces sp. bgisy100]|uniref:divisome protein SepX/GlpR n=1 Tax=Streptomyces sp. bgisy100 TaxID=3413783 RepID=UPI003D71E5A8